MIEKKYSFKNVDEKLIERVIADEHIHLNHMILPKGDRLPEHYSNSNIYMVIVNGTMTIQLADQESQNYQSGEVLNIPYNIKMNVVNIHEPILEFFVFKSPNPDNYSK